MHPNIKLDELIDKSLKSKQCFRLVPLGSSPTLPVPVKTSAKVYLSILFYSGKKVEGQSRIQIYRPHTTIILNYPTAKIKTIFKFSSKKQSNADQWKEPIGEFPHKKIETLTLNEYKKRKSELIADYEKAIKFFNGTTSDEKFKNSFRERFHQLCEPSLIPFMKETGPKFFDWLNCE